MFKNYFKIAGRNIYRHKVYTAINVLGLALGISACIVVFLITRFELSFDKFHPDKERIFRIVGEMQRSSGEKEFLNSLVSDVAGFENEIPGFEAQAGFHLYSANIKIPDAEKPAKKFDNRIEGSYSATAIVTWPQYFDIFKYEWLAGNAATLNAPYKVVLSEKRARKYFGDISLDKMIGKTVIYDDSVLVSVSGIVKDWTKKTDFGFTDFISISTAASNSFLKNQIPTVDWRSLSPHRSMAFVKLKKGVTQADINNKFAAFIKDHIKLNEAGSSLSMKLQPLTDIHFTSDFHRGDDGDDFRKPYLPTLYALMGLALFILLIAAVNFINLSTAQSMQRVKEIGVRKVMGSGKINIIFQFLTETLVLTFVAVVISILLVNPILFAFKDFIPQGITFNLLDVSSLTFLFLITLITSLLGGLYPATVLASYLPALSLKGTIAQYGGGKVNLRKGLIVFQFTISLVFIIGSIVMGNQNRFMRNTNKGFNTDAIITINHWRDDGRIRVLADKAKQITGIDKIIVQGNSPMGFAQGQQNFKYKSKDGVKDLTVLFDAGDENFIPFYQMKLLAGRNMLPGDSSKELVINETCTRAMGYTNPGDAIGQFVYWQDRPYPIVGVVADFHQGSFHDVIKPLAIGKEREWSLAIKLGLGKNINDVKIIIARLEREWKELYPDEGFNYSFLNDAISRLYEQEDKTAWLMNTAMIITIFISCMGLFGLAMFTAQKRTKEIGIRKVLGASVINITSMLSRDFTILVIISIAIASPVAWYFMDQWLRDFAYRTNVSWWVFVIAGIVALAIALITVSFQAIKAAIANPVRSLRSE